MIPDYWLLIVSYSTTGIIYLAFLLTHLIRERKLSAIFIVRTVYLIIYSVVPLIVFIHIKNNGIDYYTRSLELSQEGINQNLMVCGLALAGYLLLEYGYSLRVKFKISNIKHRERFYTDKGLWIASWIMTIISIFSFLIWTAPFGGPFAMIEYGTLIRSGYEIQGIQNTFGFMKQFVPLAQFSSIISLGLFREQKKFTYFVHFALAFLISLLYLIANDGRAPFMMYFASLIILWVIARKPEAGEAKIKIVPLIVLGLLGIFFVENIDSVLNILRGSSFHRTEEAKNIFTGFLYTEFSWTVRNAQCVRIARQNGVGYRLILDLASAVFALLPSRFTPLNLVRLEKINNIYWFNGIIGYGGKPTDIVVTGLYQLGIVGAVILPGIYGFIIRKVDDYFQNENLHSVYYKILFVQLIYQFAKTVSYADFALVALNLFYIVIGHLIVTVCNRNSYLEETSF